MKVLESNGFKTAAISAHTWTGENTDFAAEFSEMHDLAARFGTRQRPKPSAKIVADHAISWIRENKDRDYFLYIHLMDTHAPHFFEGDAQRFFGASSYAASSFAVGGTLKDRNSVPSGEDRRYANALYDGSLRYADRHIGRVVEFLRQGGLLDSTILAITSDHGELIFEHPGGRERKAGYLFSHGGPWYDPLAKIPLIIHYPRTLESVEFDHFSEGVDVGPTLLSLLEVPVPAGKKFDGVDLVQVIKGKVPPKDHVLERGSIRTDKYKCIFLTPPRDVLLGEPPPDPDTLGGELYDLVADPRELINLFESKPETVRDLLRRFRASMAARFQRYEAARCSEQPRSAFAIAARHLQSDKPLPEASGRHPWYGWVRLMRGGQLVLAAGDTNEPLAVHCPLPNGIYELSLDLHGHVVIEIDDQVRELHAAGVVEFGVIVVKDEVFRATIRPVDNKQVSVKHFGFIPSIADTQDSEAAKEQLERLRALGYID